MQTRHRNGKRQEQIRVYHHHHHHHHHHNIWRASLSAGYTRRCYIVHRKGTHMIFFSLHCKTTAPCICMSCLVLNVYHYICRDHHLFVAPIDYKVAYVNLWHSFLWVTYTPNRTSVQGFCSFDWWHHPYIKVENLDMQNSFKNMY